MEYRTIKCNSCGKIFSSDKKEVHCQSCGCLCSRKEKDATDVYEVKFKCPHCEKFIKFEKGMVRCPVCNKIIKGLKSGEFMVNAYGDINEALKYGTIDDAIAIAQYDLVNGKRFSKTDDKIVNNIKAIALALISILLTVGVVAIIKSVS